MSSHISSAHAIASIQDIADALRPYVIPGKRAEFVLCGGAALFLHGLRSHVKDIDAFVTDESVYIKWLEHGTEKIDITANPFMWGDIKIQDYHKAEDIYRDPDMVIRLLSRETLFIQKADSAREHDIEDCRKLSRSIQDPIAIAARMGELKHGNDYMRWCRSAQNLLAEIQAQYMVVPDADMIMATRMEIADQVETADGFGIELEHAHGRTARA